MNVQDIRNIFINKYKNKEFRIDKSGVKTLEIIGASFEANEEFIFGEPNYNYIKRELEWYDSMSLNVNDIPGKVPKIWKDVADNDGYINSNYGWCIYSKENYNQYQNCLGELLYNPYSRRATMIYNRPNMWEDYDKNSRSDFMCTFSTQHFINNGLLINIVYMRSNDLRFGYLNDFAWQNTIANRLMNDINEANYESNNYKNIIHDYKITWIAGSLHMYEKDFYILDQYIKDNKL